MIDCVTCFNAHLYKDQLEQMFRRRYDIFVKRRRWAKLAQPDGLERDQFDNDAAIYLLSINPAGVVDGGLRLIPTTEPHLLSEIFSHAVSGPVPRGPAIYEMTRYFTMTDRTQPHASRRVAGELLCSMLEYCLGHSGEWITTLFDTFYVPRMRQNGWDQELIGPPTRYDEGIAVAAKIAVTDENLRASRVVHKISGPMLRVLEAQRPSKAA
jgi:acyl-homoserine lactone synthase